MRFPATYASRALRFKRWSRKSYAVFCSLGKLVSIVHLPSYIADASLAKNSSIHSSSYWRHLLSASGIPALALFHDDKESPPPEIVASILSGTTYACLPFGCLETVPVSSMAAYAVFSSGGCLRIKS